MAEKKYMSLENLQEYDALIKAKIDDGDARTYSWDELENRPFYTESPVLYNGYPEISWFSSRLSFMLHEGRTYHVEHTNANNDLAGQDLIAEIGQYGGVVLKPLYSEDNAYYYELLYDSDSNVTYFYPIGTAWKEGMPETSEDGSYSYTSKLQLIVEHKDVNDLAVVQLDEKYIPSSIARVSDHNALESRVEGVESALDAFETVVTDDIATAKQEAIEAANTAANAVKNDLLNGAGEAYDTLKELGDLIDDNQDAISALETVATGKADKEHDHSISDVAELEDTIGNLMTAIEAIGEITSEEISALFSK